MKDRFAEFPRDLASRVRMTRLGPAPALLAHPDWTTPAPLVLWLHGRTVNKELDPGRYLRWVRAGIAACAIDLPGHGERLDPSTQEPVRNLDVLEAAVGEIDRVVEALADPAHHGLFDLDRMAIGGMSLGGMITFRRLCDPHSFRCAVVEGTTGWFKGLYFPEEFGMAAANPRTARQDPARVDSLDPQARLAAFRPIPLLALHSEADRLVPFPGLSRFLNTLRDHYHQAGADPALIELKTWPQTGAPHEHIGFGRFTNDARTTQTQFLTRHLMPHPASGRSS